MVVLKPVGRLPDGDHDLQMTAAEVYNFSQAILREAFQPSQPFDTLGVEARS
jgi:hypothetical protein